MLLLFSGTWWRVSLNRLVIRSRSFSAGKIVRFADACTLRLKSFDSPT